MKQWELLCTAACAKKYMLTKNFGKQFDSIYSYCTPSDPLILLQSTSDIHLFTDVLRNLIPSSHKLDIVHMLINSRRKMDCDAIEYPLAMIAVEHQQPRCNTNLSLTPKNIYDSLYTKFRHSYNQIIVFKISF
ncbi:unnamed protein product [Rangifer tarandus platyrhynchus]|uniref:Uncharacterized protein n=2 Tax=Rangifer tarandus platyrhynchus TaxID=3082113 RepID=A0ABN9A0N6_RANTA|nr:unnamed protein product [Rangifer tarandus platyrhynchus]